MNALDALLNNEATRAVGQSNYHESARAQVAGAVSYIDDMPVMQGTLYAAPVCSPVAHGRLRGVDASAALAQAGVHAVLTHRDVPGDPMLAAFAHDEPVLAIDTSLPGGAMAEAARLGLGVSIVFGLIVISLSRLRKRY